METTAVREWHELLDWVSSKDQVLTKWVRGIESWLLLEPCGSGLVNAWFPVVVTVATVTTLRVHNPEVDELPIASYVVNWDTLGVGSKGLVCVVSSRETQRVRFTIENTVSTTLIILKQAVSGVSWCGSEETPSCDPRDAHYLQICNCLLKQCLVLILKIRVHNRSHKHNKSNSSIISIHWLVLLVDHVLDHLLCIGKVRAVSIEHQIAEHNNLHLLLHKWGKLP